MASRWGASSWTASSTWESDHLVWLSPRVCSFFRPSSLFPSPLCSCRLILPSFLLLNQTFYPLFPHFHTLRPRLLTASPGVSVFRTLPAMLAVYPTRMPPCLLLPTLALCGGYTVALWWFQCKPGHVHPQTVKCRHRPQTYTCAHPAASPLPAKQNRCGQSHYSAVSLLTPTCLVPRPPPSLSLSISLTPSGLIQEFVLKLFSSSSIPCFLGFSQDSNPISPSAQSQQVWINCQAT